jgi:Flp pilus assembly protein TadB
MLKLTLAYLAGAATIGAAVYAAGGRATLAAFGIGFFIACLIAIAFLSSARRMRRAGRFLFAFAAGLDRTPRRPRIVKAPRPAAVPIAPPAAAPSPVELDVIHALKNFGMGSTEAKETAAAAVAQAPAGSSFQEVFRTAMNFRKQAA